MVYYEQAEAYFRKAKIDSELAITLASKAGINISLRRYGQARKALEESLRIIDENKLTIQQKEKIYNNLYLVDFLEFEEKENCIECVQNYATTTIAKLEKLLSSRPCGKNHVILTNIASLYLYNEDIPGYIATKRKFNGLSIATMFQMCWTRQSMTFTVIILHGLNSIDLLLRTIGKSALYNWIN